MTKKKISAKEIVDDVRAGLDDSALMKKHGLSEKGLATVFKSLVSAGALDQSELNRRTASRNEFVETVANCPSCGAGLSGRAASCPECGALLRGAEEGTESYQEPDLPGMGGSETSRRGLGPSTGRRLQMIIGALAAVLLVVVAGLVYWLKRPPEASQRELMFAPVKEALQVLIRQTGEGVSLKEYQTSVNTLSAAVADLGSAVEARDPEVMSRLREALRSLKEAEDIWLKSGDPGMKKEKAAYQRHVLWARFLGLAEETILIMEAPPGFSPSKLSVTGIQGPAEGRGDSGRQAELAWQHEKELMRRRAEAKQETIRKGLDLLDAATDGAKDKVLALLGQGVDIEVRNEDGNTPLMLAYLGGHKETMKVLLDRGADIHAQNNTGVSPVRAASAKGHADRLRMLLDLGAGVTPELLNDLLFATATTGNADSIKVLLEKGADPNAKDRRGKTPLDIAVELNDNKSLSLFLAGRTPISPETKSAAFQASVQSGNVQAAQMFLDRGCDANMRTASGLPLLVLSADVGDKAMTKLLLSKGADPNARDSAGKPVLISATEKAHAEIVSLLLNAGADPQVKDNDGNIALVLAATEGRKDLVAALLSAAANPDATNAKGINPLLAAVSKGNKDLVDLLLKRGADPNAPSPGGNSALLMAAFKGYTEIADLLVKAGAHVNAKNKTGDTPLFASAVKGHKDIVQMLLAAGADVHARNSRGNAALYAAASGGYQDIVQILLNKGADVNSKNNNGETALTVAGRQRHFRVVELLMRHGAKR